jgi:hypothetical protein
MDRCTSDAMTCWIQSGFRIFLTAWLSLHGPLAWVINGMVVIAAVVLAVWAFRWYRAYFRELLERDAQRIRSEKMLDHQTVAVIRESEEWCLEADKLKASWAQIKLVRHLRERGQFLFAVSLLPIALLMLIGLGSLPFGAFRQTAVYTVGIGVLGTFALLWWCGCTIWAFWGIVQIKRVRRSS